MFVDAEPARKRRARRGVWGGDEEEEEGEGRCCWWWKWKWRRRCVKEEEVEGRISVEETLIRCW